MDGRVDKALAKRRSTGDDLQGRKKAVKVAAVAHHAAANPTVKQADRGEDGRRRPKQPDSTGDETGQRTKKKKERPTSQSRRRWREAQAMAAAAAAAAETAAADAKVTLSLSLFFFSLSLSLSDGRDLLEAQKLGTKRRGAGSTRAARYDNG